MGLNFGLEGEPEAGGIYWVNTLALIQSLFFRKSTCVLLHICGVTNQQRNYRDQLKKVQILLLLSRTQAGPVRVVEQEVGDNSRNHVLYFWMISVLP